MGEVFGSGVRTPIGRPIGHPRRATIPTIADEHKTNPDIDNGVDDQMMDLSD